MADEIVARLLRASFLRGAAFRGVNMRAPDSAIEREADAWVALQADALRAALTPPPRLTSEQVEAAAKALWKIGNARIGERSWGSVAAHYIAEATVALEAAQSVGALTPPQHDMERFSEQSRRLALAIVEGVRQYPDMALDAVAAYVEGSVVELCNRSGVAAPPQQALGELTRQQMFDKMVEVLREWPSPIDEGNAKILAGLAITRGFVLEGTALTPPQAPNVESCPRCDTLKSVAVDGRCPECGYCYGPFDAAFGVRDAAPPKEEK